MTASLVYITRIMLTNIFRELKSHQIRNCQDVFLLASKKIYSIQYVNINKKGSENYSNSNPLSYY